MNPGACRALFSEEVTESSPDERERDEAQPPRHPDDDAPPLVGVQRAAGRPDQASHGEHGAKGDGERQPAAEGPVHAPTGMPGRKEGERAVLIERMIQWPLRVVVMSLGRASILASDNSTVKSVRSGTIRPWPTTGRRAWPRRRISL